MQPTIICTSAVPGMLRLNGRFAGECSDQRPLCAPVSPAGALYLEYAPLSGSGDLARKLVFSGGAPQPDSVADAEGLRCVLWPGGAVELDLTPVGGGAESFALEGVPCRMTTGERPSLSFGGLALSLPAGAERPRLLRFTKAAALLGALDDGGSYLIGLNLALAQTTGTLTADRVDFIDDETLSAIVSQGDGAGRGRLEQWRLDEGGLYRVSSEPAWLNGAPRLPHTAEAAMIDAVEAALAGDAESLKARLSPALAAAKPLQAVAEICELCLPMKYPLPDGRPCVALLKRENPRLARVRPLYYRAAEDEQGEWRITWVEM